MASGGQAAVVCLNIAVDHRISALFRPVACPSASANSSDHVAVLQDGGFRLARPRDEILVTGELAGPAQTGGIAVALQQPREAQPFEMGTEAVINNCNTFLALKEIFPVISCGSLHIIKDISIIDLLPFVTEAEVSFMDEEKLRTALQISQQTFCAKKPDVVLCAGKLPWTLRNCKEQMWRLESIGVGRVDKFPVAKLLNRDGKIVEIKRVNCFHPSHAINYKSEYSSLRQLLLLEAAKACGVYRGDWEEEDWMENMRSYCRDVIERQPSIPEER